MNWFKGKKDPTALAKEQEAERIERENGLITVSNKSLQEQREDRLINDLMEADDEMADEMADEILEAQILAEIEKVEARYRAMEKEEFDFKVVIDTAKLECEFCTNPQGTLKVNYDTPTIQNKRIATVKEKDATSLIFTGNCTKSPNSASPCASVMQLGKWEDIGSFQAQDKNVLLQKSTIKCKYGGATIKITDCAQRNEVTELDTTGYSVPQYVPPSCLVLFELLDTYEGEFGFDWMRTNYKQGGDCIEGLGNLEEVYTPSFHGVKSNKVPESNKRYYAPWLSMFVNHHKKIGKEVELKVVIPEEYISKDIQKTNKKDSILFEPSNPNLRIVPSSIPVKNIEKQHTIKIYCDAALQEDAIIRVKLANFEIGRMNVIKNDKTYELPIRFIRLIGGTGYTHYDRKVFEDFNDDVFTEIKDYIKNKGLNQALITAVYEEEESKIYKTHIEGSEKTKDKKYIKEIEINFKAIPHLLQVQEIEGIEQPRFLKGKKKEFSDYIMEQHDAIYGKFKGTIVFITSINPTIEENESGFALLRETPVFITTGGTTVKQTYLHEIAHTLGLLHSFETNKETLERIAIKETIIDEKIGEIEKIKPKIVKEKSTLKQLEGKADAQPVTYTGGSKSTAKEARARCEQLLKEYQESIAEKQVEIQQKEKEIEVLKEVINPFVFKKSATENLMDYPPRGTHSDAYNELFKHQWLLLQEGIKKQGL